MGDLPKSGFALSVSRVGDEVTLGVSGRLDANNYERLRRAVEDACTATPPPVTVFLDLAQLNDLDVDTIAMLVQTAEMCADLGVHLRPSFSDAGRKLLQTAGYDEALRPLRPPP